MFKLSRKQIYKSFVDNIVIDEIQDYSGLISENARNQFKELIKHRVKQINTKIQCCIGNLENFGRPLKRLNVRGNLKH